jgi:hypothetical protein
MLISALHDSLVCNDPKLNLVQAVVSNPIIDHRSNPAHVPVESPAFLLSSLKQGDK